jgi:hypothetical protein
VKVLQEILGHFRIDVIMNVYAHVLPHIQEEAMGRFAERLRCTGFTLARDPERRVLQSVSGQISGTSSQIAVRDGAKPYDLRSF